MNKHKGKYEVIFWYKSKRAKYKEIYFSRHRNKTLQACLAVVKNYGLAYKILEVVIRK
jgi:hypothetical protein